MGRATKEPGSASRPCPDCRGTGGSGFPITCVTCNGHGVADLRCAQCSKWLPWDEFLAGAKRSDRLVGRCEGCRTATPKFDQMTPAEKDRAMVDRRDIRKDGPLRVKFVLESQNRKVGKIPVSMTSARTCPTTCSFYGNGCYAEQHFVGIHWRRVSDGIGIDWYRFCDAVLNLPKGQVWWHNEAGDLPGDDGVIDGALFMLLVSANAGKRGFTYTHKPVLTPSDTPKPGEPVKITHEEWLRREKNQHLIREANLAGFTVNFSADSLDEADRLYDLGIGPVTVVLPSDSPTGLKTPDGRPVVVCPAETHETVRCSTCQLCAVTKRKSIVGFRAHGAQAGKMTQNMRQLPLFAGASR